MVALQRKLPTALKVGHVTGMSETDLVKWIRDFSDQRMVGEVFYEVHPLGNGFAYEIHEGGHRTSVLAGIIERVKAAPEDYTPDVPLLAYAQTASKLLAIEAHALGIGSMMLPDLDPADGDVPQESEETRGTKPLRRIFWLRRARHRQAMGIGFLVGAVVAGLLAAIV